MKSEIEILKYDGRYFDDCLAIFDANCPKYFAENERSDYQEFLEAGSINYFVGILESAVVSAFGLTSNTKKNMGRLSWILVSPEFKDHGIGNRMMNFVINLANKRKLSNIKISASHLSAPFFKKYDAKEIKRIENGWGSGMHRIDMELRVFEKNYEEPKA